MDGKYLASSSGADRVFIWKKEGDKYNLYKRIKEHEDGIYALSFSQDRLATGSYDRTVRLYDVKNDFRLIKVIRGYDYKVFAVAFSPDGKYLITSSSDNRILLYDKDGNFIREFSKKKTVPAALAFSPDGRFLLAGSYLGKRPAICYLYEFPSVYSAAISSDGKRIAFGFTLWPSEHRERKKSWGPLVFSFDLIPMRLKKISSEKGFLRARNKNDGLELSWNPVFSTMARLPDLMSLLQVRRENEVKAQIIRDESDGYLHSCFSFVNERFVISGGANGKVFVYNLRGEKVAELVGHEGEVWAVAVTPDGKWAVTGASDQTVRIWYLGDIKDVNWGDEGVDWEKLKAVSPLTWEWWYPKKNEIASLRSSNPIQWRAWVNALKAFYMPIRKIYPTLTLFPSKDGKEWVAWTPEGYFTGSSPSALRLIGYHINQGFEKQARWTSFSQLYDIYFRPDLVKLKLARPTIDLAQYTRVAKVKEALETSPPPEVEILSPREGSRLKSQWATIRVKVKDKGGRIGDIRVYVNGKIAASEGIYRVAKAERSQLAQADTLYATKRGVRLIKRRRVYGPGEEGRPHVGVLAPKEYTPLKGEIEKTYRVPLAPGENTITVQAMNGENTILSGPATVKIWAEIPRTPSRLFVLALGVKRFKDPKFNLNYTLNDARAFLKEMKTRARGVYKEVVTRLLEDAGKEEVLSAFYAISRQMRPTDAFVFYAATHGTVTDDRYWLITGDFSGELSEETSLTSDEIMELMKALPAQRQVMILDTCHAGSVDWTMLDLYQARLTAFSMGSGMHVLSGASSQEEANEGYRGHGHFTYFVLKALEGEADSNHDKKITVVEMAPYVKARVEKVTGGTQRPIAVNYGRDVVMTGR